MLINNASEDENKGTEESEALDDEYLPDFTKLQPYFCNLCSKRVRERKLPREKNHQIQQKTAAELEILSEVLVVNANKWLIMQEAFAAWIKTKFLKIILKVYFHSFLKHFYSVIC